MRGQNRPHLQFVILGQQAHMLQCIRFICREHQTPYLRYKLRTDDHATMLSLVLLGLFRVD